jgi:CRISPR/Cas system-associated exonuclease Cas4 (RecB family)
MHRHVKGTMSVAEEEEDEAQVEASLDELIAKKQDRPAPVDEDDDDEVMLAMSRDEAREPLTTRVLPVQQNEFICKSCFLVKHRSQLADQRRQLCRDCA